MSRHQISKTGTGWKQDKTVLRSISSPQTTQHPQPTPVSPAVQVFLHNTYTGLFPSHSLTRLNAKY